MLFSRGKARLAALAVLVASVGSAGCGGGSSGEPSDAGVTLGAPVQLANCTDWQAGSAEERLGTISQIREFFGGSVPGTGGTGRTLEDDEAYDLFENFCAAEYARGFTLYRLYTRAAAFQDLAPPP